MTSSVSSIAPVPVLPPAQPAAVQPSRTAAQQMSEEYAHIGAYGIGCAFVWAFIDPIVSVGIAAFSATKLVTLLVADQCCGDRLLARVIKAAVSSLAAYAAGIGVAAALGMTITASPAILGTGIAVVTISVLLQAVRDYTPPPRLATV